MTQRFEGSVIVGLRHKDTSELVAVYPEPLEGNDREIEEKVKFWYYQQNCEAEDKLTQLYVDTLTERELKNLPH